MRKKENIVVKHVWNKQQLDDFVRLPRRLYAGNPCYVPDLETDVRQMIVVAQTTSTPDVMMQPFVAYDIDTGEPLGRIVGIINYRANRKWETKVVRFGYIEFIDDPNVSAALLEAVEEWGRQHGMDCIQGPLGVSDLDKEGMLLEDFDQMGSSIATYNLPYYRKHLEALHYEKVVDWVQTHFVVPQESPKKYARVSRTAKEMFGLHIHPLTRKDIRRHGYAQRVFALINEAYAPLFGYSELSEGQIEAFVKQYVPLLNLDMVICVENEQNELVGVCITMFSLSEALRKSHGRLLPFGWFHLLRALKWKHADKADLMLIAVRPDCQGMGINAIFFDELVGVYNRYGVKTAETGPQLELNERELAQWKPLNPTFGKRRRCWGKKIQP